MTGQYRGDEPSWVHRLESALGARLDERFDKLEEQLEGQERRISALERWKAWAGGVGAALGAVWTLLTFLWK